MATKQLYTLEDLFAARATSVVDLGLENILNSVIAYGNFLVRDLAEQTAMFVEETTNAREFWGGVGQIEFTKVGEFGKSESQRDIKDQEVQFPLDKLSAAHAVSNEFWKRATANEVRKLMIDMDNAYTNRNRKEIQRCIFRSTSRQWQSSIYPQDGILTKIQPFINADGATIPLSPNGTAFVAASHQHYNGTSGSALSTYDVNALLSNVAEHVAGAGGQVVLFVDPAMPVNLVALSGSLYTPNQYVNVVPKTTSDIGSARNIDGSIDRANTFVGVWDGYEVHTRSWVPTGYMAALAVGAGLAPIKRRVDPAFRGMLTDGMVTDGRLSAQDFYTYVGYGVYNRAAGACLDTLHQTNYTDPAGLLTD